MTNPMTLTIQEIVADVATCRTMDGQVWRIPLNAIHGTPKAGSELRLIAAASGAEDAGKTEFAHAIINELLGSTSS